MILYHTVSAVLLISFLSLLFHGTVRAEVESAVDSSKTYEKVVAYFCYVLIAVITAYVWPISIIVLLIIFLIMWGVGYDYTRR